MKLNKKIVISVLIFFVLLCMCIVLYKNKKNTYSPEEQYELKELELQQIYYGTGVVRESGNTLLLSKNKEKVKTVYISKGEEIEEGMKVCEFDISTLDARINKLKEKITDTEKNKVTSMEENIQLLEVKLKYLNNRIDENGDELELLKLLLEKVRQKLQVDHFSDEYEKEKYLDTKVSIRKQVAEINNLNTQYEKEKKDILNRISKIKKQKEKRETKIKKWKNRIKLLKKRKKQAIYYAEVSGIVKEVYAVDGQELNEGKVANIVSSKGRYIAANVDEEDYKNICIGMNVEIICKGYNDFIEYTGTVTEMENIIKDGECNIVIELSDNTQIENLILNQNVAVNFIENSKNCLAVPYDYIYSDTEGNLYVWKYVSNKKEYEKVDVERGIDDGYLVEINAKPLKIGDCIVKRD